MIVPWSKFEAGWKLFKEQEADHPGSWLSGPSSWRTQLRYVPSTDLWRYVIEPERQVDELSYPHPILFSSEVSQIWAKVIESYTGTVQAKAPHAVWNPQSSGWEVVKYEVAPPPRPPQPPTPPPTTPPQTPLERMRERARKNRQAEMDAARNEFADGHLDEEEFNRRIAAIEEKFKELI